MNPHLLIIDDDQRLASMVATYLEQNSMQVTCAYTASDGLAQLQNTQHQAINLILLDIMLPDKNGLDVCREIRALPAPFHSTPIIMLTAKGDALDQIIGLEIGADDYVPKPFEPRQLLARVRAVLRRPPIQALRTTLRFGKLEIDPEARTLSIDGQEKTLTAYQFDLLIALAERAGRVLSREIIMDLVKGESLDAFDRSIDVHIGRIRNAIEEDPKHPKRIITVRGAGYLFARNQD